MSIKHNTEEYDNPILYDKENNDYTDDIPFLQKWALKAEGTILDIACGTGRVTIPLAKSGYKIVGIDSHEGMLNEAKKKAGKLNLPIEWIQQDCTKLELNFKTDFAFSVGNSFQHFLKNEDQDGLLSSVNRHLFQNGIFIFNTRFPSVEELLQPETEEFWYSYIDDETQYKVDVSTIAKYDALNQLQYYTTIRKYKDETNHIVNEVSTNITLRYVYPKEMERMLANHGFEVIQIYEDWQENLITNDSYSMNFVCKKVSETCR